jgi:indole-3-glycerol phosphate synthase
VTSIHGVTDTGSILDKIVLERREGVEARKRRETEVELRARFADFDPQWGLTSAISTPRGHAPAEAAVQIIAEIKKASPSKGMLAPDLDHRRVAKDYALGGAAGISVLTEENYFLGSLEWMRDVRTLLTDLLPGERPSVLRKDFLVEPYELVQARAYGADNVLLIVALLELELLKDLIAQAADLGLDALVEVHNEAEAARAVQSGARLLGVNNRDLHTFKVDLAVTERIRPLLPPDAIVVGESGVNTHADVERLHAAGTRAVLVGEAFMTATDVAAKMAELRG